MLAYIEVRNIALIEEIHLNLDSHLNIFSGETGAGKSMLIDSIQFAIGNRSSKQMIRRGADMGMVELCFKDDLGLGVKFLEECGIASEDNNIIINRAIYQSGKTIYKVNGASTNKQTVKALAAVLIDVHGQHEPQSLLDISNHIKLLDSFGNDEFLTKKKEYLRLYEEYNDIKKKLSSIGDDDRKKFQLKDMLTYQINEINEARLKVGEEEALKEQHDTLAYAEKISMQCQKAYALIDGDGQMSASMLIGEAISALQDISFLTKDMEALYEQFLSIQAEMQDATYTLRDMAENIEYSPEALMEVQTRLDLIYKLKQKYGNSIEEVLNFRDECEVELNGLESSEHNKEALVARKQDIEIKLNDLAEYLSNYRKEIAAQVEEQIDMHLHDLQMPYAKFEVSIEEIEEFNSNGKNDVEFLIRTNLGEDIRPLSKIASGGEISRVMLAIKTVLFLGDTINTVIFDEIDTGISGIAAQKVGQKLGLIAKERQVICITHLSQIAAMADSHFLITKEAANDKTTTSLTKLNEEEIYRELARLMGGIVTDSTINSAKELKETCNEFKKACK